VLRAATLAFSVSLALGAEPAISIKRTTQDGQPVVVIENEFYRTVLAYTRARLPLSYFFKTTGHELCVMPTPLSQEGKRFQYYGGVIDSIPWVSGRGLQSKGLLWNSEWKVETKQEKGKVTFTGVTGFTYNDPVSKAESQLKFVKVIEGYAGTSCLSMKYLIENTGKANAKFMLSAHSRVAVGGGWTDGDYFHAPGRDAHLYYTFGKWPELVRQGIIAPCWVRWPFEPAARLKRTEERKGVFVYVPASWCCVGDPKEKECLFFVASPVNLAGRKRVMRMGIFMTNDGYVVEPCLTYRIGAMSWAEPEATVMLKPGEKCEFTLSMVAYAGLEEDDVRHLYGDAVLPDCLLPNRFFFLNFDRGSGKLSLWAKIISAGRGVLTFNVVEADGTRRQPIKMPMSPGKADIRTGLGQYAEHPRVEASLTVRGFPQPLIVIEDAED